MIQDTESLLIGDTQTMDLPQLQELILQFQDQLNSLDYRVTNKNFGSKIYQAKETIASKGRFVAGAEDDVVIMDGQNPTWRIWAGTKDPATAPFRVDKNGNMVATSVTLTGYVPAGGSAADINANTTTINGGKITTNTIQASAIVAGSLVVGTNVGLGTAQTAAQVTTIVGNTVTTGYVNALNVTAGSVAAENITGTYITGKTVRTASSGIRAQMTGSQFEIYDGTYLRALGYSSGWTYYNASGQTVADIFADTSSYGSKSLFITANGVSGGNLIQQTNASGTYAIYNGSQIAATWWQYSMYSYYDVQPATSDLLLGGDPYSWRRLFVDTVGYVTSSGGEGTPFPVESGWSVTHLATGRYRVNHPMNTVYYSAVITPVAAAAKVWSIEDRSSGSFTVRIASFAGTLEDNDFMFICLNN